MIERYLAAILVLGVGGNELFHAIFDGMDFAFSAQFVRDAISMEYTSDPDAWRAIHNPTVAAIGYGFIWLAHALSGGISLAGATLMLRHPAGNLRKAYVVATLGVGIGAVLYLVGFMTIAGGWFLLYSAPTPPNFVDSAMMNFICYFLVIIYLNLLQRN